MEDNKIEVESGVSLGQIFSWVWRGKIIGIIVAVFLFIFLFLCISFLYNASAKVYTVSFQYSNVPNLSSETYLDGTKFNYNDIISEENVLSVVNSDKEAFSSINVDKLFESNQFIIKQKLNYRDEANKDFTIVSTTYTMMMPSKIFKSFNQAKKFCMDLIKIPVNKTLNIIDQLNYNSNIILSKDASDFNSQLSFIQSQIHLLNKGYEQWINNYGGEVTVIVDSNEFSLNQLKNNIDNYLDSVHFSVLSEEVRLNGLVKNPSVEISRLELEIATYRDEKEQLLKVKDSINAQLDKLYENLGTTTAQTPIINTDGIVTLISKITDIEQQIIAIDKSIYDLDIKLNNINLSVRSASLEFEQRLEQITSKIEDFTKTYTSVSSLLYQRDMSVYYSNSNVLVSSGGFGLIMTVAASGFVGLFVGLIIAGILGYNYSKKEDKMKVELNQPEVTI